MWSFFGQQWWHSDIVFSFEKRNSAKCRNEIKSWIALTASAYTQSTFDTKDTMPPERRRQKRWKVNLIKVIKAVQAEEQSLQTFSRRKEFSWNLLRELLSIQFTSPLAWLSVAKREFWTCESRKRFFLFPRDSYFMDERNFVLGPLRVCVNNSRKRIRRKMWEWKRLMIHLIT